MSSFRKYSITFENKASSFFNRRSICSQCWYLITASHRPQKPDPERSYIRWTIQAVFFENKALLTPVANKSHAHHFVLLYCAFWMTQRMTESKLNEDFWGDSQLEAENKAVDLTENKIYREKVTPIYYLGIYQLRFKGNRLCYRNHKADARLWGSHIRDYKNLCPLGCDAVWSGSYGPRVTKTRPPLP